jgi:selenocysteine-specific elongation factor
MRPVIGTAGHIDHGKTTLLRALTGIDADRLPEEQRRGMTIDVGYAHLDLEDGTGIDFVDVPGHDRLVGNMLVGAGEIDAVMLVVAADDGPSAQTLEHLELLDGLGIADGLIVVTKVDLVEADRRDEVAGAIGALAGRTGLAGATVLAVSAATGDGIDTLRLALADLAGRVLMRTTPGRPRLALDRVFSVRGRGTVVTGTLRGGVLDRGAVLLVQPGDGTARVREIQVHGGSVERAEPGRTALNLAPSDPVELRRGMVLSTEGVEVSDRLLVVLRRPPPLRTDAPGLPEHGARLRLHLGTDQVDATVSRHGRDGCDLPGGEGAAVLRLERPVAAAIGDRFVLRRPSPAATAAGGRILDPLPPRGVARRRMTPHRIAALADAAGSHADAVRTLTALVDLHGALPVARLGALGLEPGTALRAGPLIVARDLAALAVTAAAEAVAAHHQAQPLEAGITLARLRSEVAMALRRSGVSREEAPPAAAAFVDALSAAGRLVREGDRVREPGRTPGLPQPVLEAMDRLEAMLAVPAPRSLDDAARASGCPPEGVRALLAAGRLVRLNDDIVYAAGALAGLESVAVELAMTAPLTPATLRDATGTSRKYVLAILEDLDRRGILRRTPEGHLPGPRAPGTAGVRR